MPTPQPTPTKLLHSDSEKLDEAVKVAAPAQSPYGYVPPAISPLDNGNRDFHKDGTFV